MRRRGIVGLALALLVAAAFAPVARNGFINFDDTLYLTENRQIHSGLTRTNVVWAFTTTRGANWHPLTWLSHLADISVFGLDPAGHHGVGLAIHAANTVLLFAFLVALSGSTWPSAFVAAVFGVHPLHVESVAWAAERKDLLSTFLGLLALQCHLAYVRRPLKRWYLSIIMLFALGLMAKPMLVVLPFILLLLDWWPLGRMQSASVPLRGARLVRAARLVLEKLPLFVLSAVMAAITLIAQRSEGSLTPLTAYPLGPRLANALVSYAAYIGKTLWPARLAVFYPHPGHAINWPSAFAAGFLLAAVTFFVVRQAARRPWLPVGWLWYLGSLVPVIGFVQVGAQAMADRYSYVPLIGLMIMPAWQVAHGLREQPIPRRFLAGVACALPILLALLTRAQVGTWRDSETLFRHALAVTGPNAVAHLNLAAALREKGRGDEARFHASEAVRLDPADPAGLNTYGLLLADRGDFREALGLYRRALRAAPDDAALHNNLGLALNELGRPAEAMKELEAAIALQPGFDRAYNNLGNAYLLEGREREALESFRESLRLRPENHRTRFNLGNLLHRLGRDEEAVAEYGETIRLHPRFADAHNNLGIVLAGQGRLREAEAAFLRATELDPGNRAFQENLASASAALAGR